IREADIYLVPTHVVDRDLRECQTRYIDRATTEEKRLARQKGRTHQIELTGESTGTNRGFSKTWAEYFEAWRQLDGELTTRESVSDVSKVNDWALRESAALEEMWPKGSPAENRVLEAWKTRRPKMLAELGEECAAALAHVLVDRKLKSQSAYERAGMSPTDAAEQAEQEWLLLEPEDDDELNSSDFD
ncbi:MAG: hypothetical protein HC869_13710, partial [Rhodospirillales bacterium]|nr:hypothetical protein [Rhodospirillales bacterium]